MVLLVYGFDMQMILMSFTSLYCKVVEENYFPLFFLVLNFTLYEVFTPDSNEALNVL